METYMEPLDGLREIIRQQNLELAMLREQLRRIADGAVMDQSKPYTQAETVLAYQELARAALAHKGA